ncbi:nicotinate-nucleotide adenylyltransferase [Lichenicoccus sp.]|uniref:nicotinate-nucleotide adenylyltransferase n=1 Tax=Lichenicoccus sp. TaxID=2781899 RepID=UPI003D0BC76A
MLPPGGDKRRMRVGLLGGSFNPAHHGHLQLAQRALRQLRLDQVWLLVSPGNPLKPVAGMAALEQRLAGAQALTRDRRILATDIERRLGTRYTVDTVQALRRRFPLVQFVWLMGADGFAELPRWRRWTQLARLVPFAVLPRPTYNQRALAGQAALRWRRARRPAREAVILPAHPVPSWIFLPAPQNDISATALRAARRPGASDA